MQPNDIGSLPPTLFADDGDPSLISANKVAEQLHLELDELARKVHLDPEKLAADAESADVQELLRNLVRAFTLADAVFMSPSAAAVWIMEPVQAFRGKTALGLVAEGLTEDVVRYLDSIESGFVG